MSKNKRKNSNYKAYSEIQTDVAVKPEMSADTKKNIIIWTTTAVIILGILLAAIISSIPRTYYVEMDFGGYGKIVLELNEEDAPITVKNFVRLVRRGFYDDTTIFRAQKNFVIQGGQDESVKLPTIKGEFEENGIVNNMSHVRGVISMARTSDPDSATSQFFITLHDSAKASLDGKYASFGHVIEGMDVVDAIAEALYGHAINSMGFVDDADAIKIVSAKIIKYNAK
jgi:peptidyl-prolyl cis-trans isomerase B (cyclophilin B)